MKTLSVGVARALCGVRRVVLCAFGIVGAAGCGGQEDNTDHAVFSQYGLRGQDSLRDQDSLQAECARTIPDQGIEEFERLHALLAGLSEAGHPESGHPESGQEGFAKIFYCPRHRNDHEHRGDPTHRSDVKEGCPLYWEGGWYRAFSIWLSPDSAMDAEETNPRIRHLTAVVSDTGVRPAPGAAAEFGMSIVLFPTCRRREGYGIILLGGGYQFDLMRYGSRAISTPGRPDGAITVVKYGWGELRRWLVPVSDAAAFLLDPPQESDWAR